MSTAWVMIIKMYASLVAVPGYYPTFEDCKVAAYEAKTFVGEYRRPLVDVAESVTCVPVPKETTE